MTRTGFMKQLQVLLSDISENEREEALQYYHDYFDDAGPEEEARILRELGSPEQVARKIKRSVRRRFGVFRAGIPGYTFC